MKRVNPFDSKPYEANKRIQLEPQPVAIHDSLPNEILHPLFILFLKFREILSMGQACKILYEISTDDYLWEKLFQREFSNAPRIALGKSWQEECKLQWRFISNCINGNYASQVFRVNQTGVSAFTGTDDGRLVLGYQDGSVKIFDPRANELTLLATGLFPEAPEAVDKLGYENGLCYAHTKKGFTRLWDLNTCKEIPVPQGETGFSVAKTRDNKINLVNGMLLKCPKANVIQMWNPREKENPVSTLQFRLEIKSMTMCGQTLFYYAERDGEGKIGIYNLKAKHHNVFNVSDRRHTYYGKIHAVNEKKFFLFGTLWERPYTMSTLVMRCEREEMENLHVSTIRPLGVGDLFLKPVFNNFPCQWSPSNQPCSLSELSSIFQAFAPDSDIEKFIIKSPVGREVERTIPCAYSQGGMYCCCIDLKLEDARQSLKNARREARRLAEDQEASSEDEIVPTDLIFRADFTASNEQILQELAQMLRSGNEADLTNAWQRFQQMPKSVQEEIEKISKELANQPDAKGMTPEEALATAISGYLFLSSMGF
jgi:hypothetical protein